MKTRVVHVKRDHYDIYAGRPSVLGNPFKISEGRDRNGVIRDHKDWLEGRRFTDFQQGRRKKVLELIPSLKGKVLACWCKPQRCHCDTLARMADKT